jgi:hypothetical protein
VKYESRPLSCKVNEGRRPATLHHHMSSQRPTFNTRRAGFGAINGSCNFLSLAVVSDTVAKATGGWSKSQSFRTSHADTNALLNELPYSLSPGASL